MREKTPHDLMFFSLAHETHKATRKRDKKIFLSCAFRGFRGQKR